MNQLVLSKIESSVLQLPPDDQLWLISRVAEKLRKRFDDDAEFEPQLAEMVSNTDIKNELECIRR